MSSPQPNEVHLRLTPDEALVLFEFLSRYNDTDELRLEDQAEQRALWNLCCLLEKELREPFNPDYLNLLQSARDRLRDKWDESGERRCTECRPLSASARFGSGGGAAIGELNVSVTPMKILPRSAAALALLAVLIAFGCSKPPPLSPVQLMQQIAASDRVVLTNWPSTSVEFSGIEAQKIIRAVSESKGHRIPKNQASSCPAGVYLQFFQGTNLLAEVFGHDGHFDADHVSYSDYSGVLQEAWKTVYEKRQKR